MLVELPDEEFGISRGKLPEVPYDPHILVRRIEEKAGLRLATIIICAIAASLNEKGTTDEQNNR